MSAGASGSSFFTSRMYEYKLRTKMEWGRPDVLSREMVPASSLMAVSGALVVDFGGAMHVELLISGLERQPTALMHRCIRAAS